MFQPPHCPELNPIERFWQYLKAFGRERTLSPSRH
ncbi:transposase [[Phormidium] sp. ETS-05]